VRLVVVRDDGVTVKVVGESPVVTPVVTGVPVTTALSPALEVQAGDEVGLYFTSTGVVPFDGTNSGGTSGTVLYTTNGSGDPTLGATLTFEGAVDRIYSVSVSGVAFFDFAGFFPPVYNDAVNSVKAGSAIPMKFSLGGYQGLGIFAAGYPTSALTVCLFTSALEEFGSTMTAGGSSLSYDPVSDQYTYVWKTDKAWAGQCRQFNMLLADGRFHFANFKFK
jgi:hypothetical protein